MANEFNPIPTYGGQSNFFEWSDRKKNQYLGTYHMSGIDSFEPQRTNNFELAIFGLGSAKAGVGVPQYANTSSGFRTDTNGNPILLPSNAGGLLKLSVKDFDAPNLEMSVLEVPYGNNKVKYAGIPNFSGGSVNFNDFIGIDTERILMSWYQQGYNVKTQAVGRASVYKKAANLLEYDPSGVFCRAWGLVGCWISSINLGSFSNENNSTRQISCNFQYDYCYPLDYPTSYENVPKYM